MKHITRWGASLFLATAITCSGINAQAAPVTAETPSADNTNANQAVQHQVPAKKKQEFWIVTNEIKAPAKDGIPEMEVYRWDPGFLVVNKGEPVTLHIYGVKGKEHPFIIEGLNVKGDVKKGKVTTVTFTPEKEGTYKIICLIHDTLEKHGPMIAYLRVE